MTTDDFHRYADLLYAELKRQPWFRSLIRDELAHKLIVEARDVVKASSWFLRREVSWRGRFHRAK